MSQPPTGVARVSPSDLELLCRVAKDRDDIAYEVLMRRHQAAAFNLAVHLTRNREHAEDALQEAMLRAWSAADSYRTEGSVRSWFLRIVVRECIKQHRRTVSESNRVTRLQENGRREAGGPHGDSNAEQDDRLEVLRRLIAELAYPQRAMLAMYFGAGLTHDDIGRELNIPRSTIALRIRESLDTLRRRMARHGIEALPSALAPAALAEAVLNGEAVPSNLLDMVGAKISAAVAKNPLMAGKNPKRAFGRISPKPGRRLTGWTVATPWVGVALLLAAIGALAWWSPMDEGGSAAGMPVPAKVSDSMAREVVKEQTRDPDPRGSVLRTIELDKNYLYYGLACDGKCLWTCRARSPAKNPQFRLAKMDLQTGSILAYGPDLGDRQYTGLDWDGERLWAVVLKDRKLLQLDASSGEALREVSLCNLAGEKDSENNSPWGVAVMPCKDIWVCNLEGAFYRLDIRSGKVTATFRPALSINQTWFVLPGDGTALVKGWMPWRRNRPAKAGPEYRQSVMRLDLATGKTSWLFDLSSNDDRHLNPLGTHGTVDAALDGAGRLWVLNKIENQVRLYDLKESTSGTEGSVP